MSTVTAGWICAISSVVIYAALLAVPLPQQGGRQACSTSRWRSCWSRSPPWPCCCSASTYLLNRTAASTRTSRSAAFPTSCRWCGAAARVLDLRLRPHGLRPTRLRRRRQRRGGSTSRYQRAPHPGLGLRHLFLDGRHERHPRFVVHRQGLALLGRRQHLAVRRGRGRHRRHQPVRRQGQGRRRRHRRSGHRHHRQRVGPAQPGQSTSTTWSPVECCCSPRASTPSPVVVGRHRASGNDGTDPTRRCESIRTARRHREQSGERAQAQPGHPVASRASFRTGVSRRVDHADGAEPQHHRGAGRRVGVVGDHRADKAVLGVQASVWASRRAPVCGCPPKPVWAVRRGGRRWRGPGGCCPSGPRRRRTTQDAVADRW